MWLLLNIRQDHKEHLDIIKHLCTFIRPEAFFNDDTKKKSVSTEVLADIAKKTGISAEEIDKVLKEDPEFLRDYGSIERVDTRKS